MGALCCQEERAATSTRSGGLSDYFRVLFWSERDTPCHAKTQESPVTPITNNESFDQIVKWMHGHDLTLTRQNVKAVQQEAHYLDCSGAVEHCVRYMVGNLTLGDAIEINRFASDFSLVELFTKSTGFLLYNFVKL